MGLNVNLGSFGIEKRAGFVSFQRRNGSSFFFFFFFCFCFLFLFCFVLFCFFFCCCSNLGFLNEVQHPWVLFLKTLCNFSKKNKNKNKKTKTKKTKKKKTTLDKVSYGSGQKCSKELKNRSLHQ